MSVLDEQKARMVELRYFGGLSIEETADVLCAVKFTPNHRHVKVKIQRLQSQLEISVQDSGAGIPEDFLPYVFDRFSQADTSSTRKHTGLGLGLAIVRHLVELHGGSVKAQSEGEEKGATFIVSLPVRTIQEQPLDVDDGELGRTAIDALAKDIVLVGLRVMIVDDEVEARELFSTILTIHGAEVKSCVSAAEALAVIDEWKPAIIVSDISMPDEDGYSFISKVRSLKSKQANIPAIALTAYARSADRMRALAAGFQMHVPKPVEATELLMVISSLVNRDVRA